MEEELKNQFLLFQHYLSTMNTISATLKEKPDDFIYKIAFVHCFETIFGLSWKIMREYLMNEGIRTVFPRDVISEVFSLQIIKDLSIWIMMLEDRKMVMEEGNIEKINGVVNRINNRYIPEFKTIEKYLIEKI